MSDDRPFLIRLAAALRYLPLDVQLAWARRCYGIEGINRFLLASPSRQATHHVLRRYGAQVAISAAVPTHLIIDNAVSGDYRHLALGEHAYLGKGCLLDLVAPIAIAEAAAVSAGCQLLTHGDPGTGRWLERTHFPRVTGPIHIGPNAWLGAGAIILPGITVGASSVVAAGAVVTHPVAPYTVVAGVPARVIRQLPQPAGGAA